MGSRALVLSGAGTKGAFEVGALRFLVGEHRFTPKIITATSAGAILGTILAQARSPAEFVDRVDDARRDLDSPDHHSQRATFTTTATLPAPGAVTDFGGA
jgi:predicted acylesterase/phospholipase RssA